MFDYESPIKQFETEMKMEYENGVIRAVQNVGFHVDKEELAKALVYDRGQYEKGYEDGLNADKWIPCSERLPKKNERILCFHSGGFIDCGDFISNTFCCDMDEYLVKKDEIIAWQPLPQPYKKMED